MSFWKVRSSITQKDGTKKVETTYMEADKAPTPKAEKLPRLPGQHEEWANGRWVVDEEAKAVMEAEAAINSMSSADRQRAAVEQAKQELMAELLADSSPLASGAIVKDK